MVYSFDIFDTLITRKTASPIGVFLSIKNKLQSSKKISNEFVVSNFVDLRLKSEKNAILFSGTDCVSFDDIYSIFQKMTRLSDCEIATLKQIEFETEKELTEGIEVNIKRLCDLQESKENIILISDMYFSEQQIREILNVVDKNMASLPIYVSSEYKASKQNGMLYKIIKEQLNIEYHDWIHYGDNQYSDFSIPKLMGMQAVLYKVPEYLPWEKKLLNEFSLSGNMQLHLYLYASRKIRRTNNLLEPALAGLSFGGLILFNYVKWIINTSIKAGFNRLYFISRDGFILQKIAEIYINEFNLNIETKYIYGSRTAWRVDSAEKRELVKNYLNQECDFSDDKYAFVDVQGTGLSFSYLSDILFCNTNNVLNAFYYTMAKSPDIKNCNFIIFSSHDNTNLIEPLCRASHGAVLGYKYENRIYAPVFAKTDESSWDKCGLNDFNNAVCLYSKEVCRLLKDADVTSYDYFSFNDALLAYSRQEPDQIIVDYFSRLYHNDNNDNEVIEYAPQLSKKQIFDIFMWRTTEPFSDYYEGFNFDFSLRRLSPEYKKLVTFYQKNYSKFLGKCIHFYKYLKTRHFLSIIPKRKTHILLYAAGKCGKELYPKLKHSLRFKLVGWTDVNYEKMASLGLNLIPASEIFRTPFDILLIAIKNNAESESARNLLVSLGIDKEKILTFQEFNSLY